MEEQYRLLAESIPGCERLLSRLLLTGDMLRLAKVLSAPTGNLGSWIADYNNLLRVVKELLDE